MRVGCFLRAVVSAIDEYAASDRVWIRSRSRRGGSGSDGRYSADRGVLAAIWRGTTDALKSEPCGFCLEDSRLRVDNGVHVEHGDGHFSLPRSSSHDHHGASTLGGVAVFRPGRVVLG